jgi:hypothetical protein
MTTEQVLAVTAGETDIVIAPVEDGTKAPETEAQTEEGQTEGQAAEGEAPEEEERKRESAKDRRERDRAYKQRLREERDRALSEAKEAKDRADRILQAVTAKQPPKESDFASYDDFTAAKTAWAVRRELAEDQANEAKAKADEAETRAATISQEEQRLDRDAWSRQVMDAKQRYADFDAVVYAENVPIPGHVAQALVRTPDGADVAYYLGQNPDIASELARLSPLDAAIEIGRITARLSAPPPKSKTSAPPPIKPVSAASGSPTKSVENMSQAEFAAWRANGGTF